MADADQKEKRTRTRGEIKCNTFFKSFLLLYIIVLRQIDYIPPRIVSPLDKTDGIKIKKLYFNIVCVCGRVLWFRNKFTFHGRPKKQFINVYCTNDHIFKFNLNIPFVINWYIQ